MKKVITGFHAIEEILKAEKNRREKDSGTAKKHCAQPLEISYSKQGPRVKRILELAVRLGINVRQEEDGALDGYVGHLPDPLKDHRGVILFLETDGAGGQPSADEFFAALSQKGTAAVAILDSITDPHNIGSIVRSADQFGIDGIIIPENRSAGGGSAGFQIIAKTSSGAAAWVPIISVPNIVRAAERLKKDGFWIYGADAGGVPVGDSTSSAKTVIVMGSEGSGLGRLMEKTCDELISIPVQGRLDSLNVSVAAGILFYEISRRISCTLAKKADSAPH